MPHSGAFSTLTLGQSRGGPPGAPTREGAFRDPIPKVQVQPVPPGLPQREEARTPPASPRRPEQRAGAPLPPRPGLAAPKSPESRPPPPAGPARPPRPHGPFVCPARRALFPARTRAAGHDADAGRRLGLGASRGGPPPSLPAPTPARLTWPGRRQPGVPGTPSAQAGPGSLPRARARTTDSGAVRPGRGLWARAEPSGCSRSRRRHGPGAGRRRRGGRLCSCRSAERGPDAPQLGPEARGAGRGTRPGRGRTGAGCSRGASPGRGPPTARGVRGVAPGLRRRQRAERTSDRGPRATRSPPRRQAD